MGQQRREVEDIDNTIIIAPSSWTKIKKERRGSYSVCYNNNNIGNSSPVCLRMVLMMVNYTSVQMLNWDEESSEEKKRFMIASAIAATIIIVGSVAAIIL